MGIVRRRTIVEPGQQFCHVRHGITLVQAHRDTRQLTAFDRHASLRRLLLVVASLHKNTHESIAMVDIQPAPNAPRWGTKSLRCGRKIWPGAGGSCLCP